MSSRVKRLGRTTSLTLVAAMVAATGGLSGAGTAGAAVPAAVPNGGMLNVLDVGTQWPNIDVAADTQDAADSDFMNAIYGQLFELAPGNKVVPDEATGYHFSNNYQTVTINIRHGLKFSNGDPFTAANVAWSINRDLEPQWGNIGDANFPLQGPVVASGPYTITANMKHPDSAIIDAFIGEAPNWTADQKALTSMGEKAYEQKPIGAGPFEVVSNAASSKLVLKKNPNYWGASKGLPHLSGITFTAVGADQSAASALEQGTDQMAQLISTIPLLQSLPSKGLRVTQPPSTFTQFIALNEGNAPFDNIKAREAVAYATDAAALTKNLYHGAFPIVEDMSGPGQEFYQQKDKYFPAYDLAKAKALVQQLGGLSVNLSTTTNTAYWTTEVEALSTMWEAAGRKVNQQDNTLQQMLAITFNPHVAGHRLQLGQPRPVDLRSRVLREQRPVLGGEGPDARQALRRERVDGLQVGPGQDLQGDQQPGGPERRRGVALLEAVLRRLHQGADPERRAGQQPRHRPLGGPGAQERLSAVTAPSLRWSVTGPPSSRCSNPMASSNARRTCSGWPA